MEIRLNQQNDTSPVIEVDDKTDLQEPALYNVILLNDDYTPMDFVIEVLMRFFQTDQSSAYSITMQVHENGRGIAGVYPKEIAEEKMLQVAKISETNEFPLTCEAEPI